MINPNKALVFSATLLLASAAYADHPRENVSGIIEEVYITGGKEEVRKAPGSATFLDDEAIKTFDSTDLNDVLGQVPGMYVRFEDGYGLRPNIGIRGATSDRSQKITIMEDGILITPAPYSAPAAYYIPNVNRMDAIEVFKGPAAIKYGPHTVGGALNLVTRAIPEQSLGELAVTLGNDNYQKYRAFYGNSYESRHGRFGYWVDGLRFSADGFKELAGSDTGFVRNDINAKFLWQSNNAAIPQKLIFKIGYADEESDETYLGITDSDFARNSVQRYAASAEDQFTSEHTQAHIIHSIEPSANLRIASKAYVNRFTRDWNKLDGFAVAGDCPASNGQALDCTLLIRDVLENPERFPYELGILRGENNSLRAGEFLDVTSNDRDYGSEGIQISATQTWQAAVTEQKTIYGLRYHRDYVDRNHQPFTFAMRNGAMQLQPFELDLKTLNRSEATAIAAYVDHQIEWNQVKINAGLRYETIDGEVTNALDQSVENSSDSVIMPGIGMFYAWSDNLGFLAGINKGFSPAVAGSGANAEESINYEYGFRFGKENLTFDIVGFYSDYSNYIGRCRASDPDCNGGIDEFNGGEANIFGAELTSSYTAEASNSITLPFALSYTYTDATFGNSFESNFSQWGNVLEGDELPYTPEHQAHFTVGLDSTRWSLQLAGKFTGKMREFPNQGDYAAGRYTRTHTLWDFSTRYIPNDSWAFLLAAENIFDKHVIVSRRPFGARPNQPLALKAGMTYTF